VRAALRAKDAEPAALAAGALYSVCTEFDHAIDAPHALAELRSRDAHADTMRGSISAKAEDSRAQKIKEVLKYRDDVAKILCASDDDDKKAYRRILARKLHKQRYPELTSSGS
jgi:hypothetical protein